MKSQLETIRPDANSSFRLLNGPCLSEVFYWHFHPEIELVYIAGTDGTRHVGEHISPYSGSDLVLIGSNIPHLNFDYGVENEYHQVVLQIQPAFVEEVLGRHPELQAIGQLMDRARKGIAFHGETKQAVGKRLTTFHQKDPFTQFVEVLELFQCLATSQEATLLHPHPFVNPYREKEQKRLRQIYLFIDQHYQRKIEVEEVANLCHLSKAAFCRYFKKAAGVPFIRFLNQYRISQAKRLLLSGRNVTESCYACGFESLSYFNRTFKKMTGENPTTFRTRHVARSVNSSKEALFQNLEGAV